MGFKTVTIGLLMAIVAAVVATQAIHANLFANLKLKIEVGQTKRVDIDGDGIADMEVTLNSIVNGRPNVTMKNLEQPKQSSGPSGSPSGGSPNNLFGTNNNTSKTGSSGQSKPSSFKPKRITIKWPDKHSYHQIFDFIGSRMSVTEIKKYLDANAFKVKVDYKGSQSISDKRADDLAKAGYEPVAKGMDQTNGEYYVWGKPETYRAKSKITSSSTVQSNPFAKQKKTKTESSSSVQPKMAQSSSTVDLPKKDDKKKLEPPPTVTDISSSTPKPTKPGFKLEPDQPDEVDTQEPREGLAEICKLLGVGKSEECNACLDNACELDPSGAIDFCAFECSQVITADGDSKDKETSREDVTRCMSQGNQDSFRCVTCLNDACRQDPWKAADFCSQYCYAIEEVSSSVIEPSEDEEESEEEVVQPTKTKGPGWIGFLNDIFGGGDESTHGAADSNNCDACRTCGDGLFNICDKNECLMLGPCKHGLFFCAPDPEKC